MTTPIRPMFKLLPDHPEPCHRCAPMNPSLMVWQRGDPTVDVDAATPWQPRAVTH